MDACKEMWEVQEERRGKTRPHTSLGAMSKNARHARLSMVYCA